MSNPNFPQRSAASASNSGRAGPASVPAQPLVLQLPAPPPLQERMNRREWKTWRQQWEDYAQVLRIGEQSKEYQAAVLRGCIGPTGLEVYSGLPFVGAGYRDDTVNILELLEGYYIGKTNVSYERYKFHSRNQKDIESTTTYIGELRRLAHSCDFENITPGQLSSDRIVCGVRDNGLRKKLLQSDNLSLDGCVSTCRASELAGAQASSMTEELRSTRSEVESDIDMISIKSQTNYIRMFKHSLQLDRYQVLLLTGSVGWIDVRRKVQNPAGAAVNFAVDIIGVVLVNAQLMDSGVDTVSE